MLKRNASTVFLLLILIAGLSLMLYPSLANWWNTRTFNNEITQYSVSVAKQDTTELDHLMEKAEAYNRELATTGNRFYTLEEADMENYRAQLSLGASSMMGYLTIPAIKVSLPIYHGTDENALSAGVGHLEGTSLPIGGSSTHSVLSGHRGLPSARLFTDLDKLVVGDTFYMEVMGRTVTYEVDQILIVLPEDTADLKIFEGEDYCTLVTCTPYGVNSHRMLIRGHRVDNLQQGEQRIIADALVIRPVMVAPFVAAPILVVLLIWLFTAPKQKKEFYEDNSDEGGMFHG